MQHIIAKRMRWRGVDLPVASRSGATTARSSLFTDTTVGMNSLSPRLLNHLKEQTEEIGTICRTGRRLWMILDRKDRQFLMPKSFDRAIIQIDVSHFHSVFQTIRVYRIAMILRRNRNASCCQIFHGMVATSMTEF